MAVICASVLMGAPAYSQTATGETAPAGGELSLGEDIAAAPAVGQAYDKDVFGDWTLRCVTTESGNDPCRLFQLLKDADGSAVSEFNLNVLPQGGQAAAGANVVTPLETLLTAKLTIQVDENQAKNYPFAFCSQIGCVSRIGLTQEDLDSYKRGSVAYVIMVPAAAPDQPLRLTLSLKGFTAGVNALQSN